MPIDPAKPFDLTFTVDPFQAGYRLDLFLKAMMPSMSRTKIQRYVRAQRLEVNGFPRPSNWIVRQGDSILLRLNVPEAGADAAKNMPLDIILEDRDILAVNKQPGLVVHPVGKHRHDTLLNILYWRYKDILPPEDEISLANRLDQYTSGVMLVAKHAAAKRVIQEDFERRVPEKTYLAICDGLLASDAGEIDLPLDRDPSGRDHCRMWVCEKGEGKTAFTRYQTVKRFAQGYTLVRLHPLTGRQHQLRVHMAAIGHPLVADNRYGSSLPLVVGTDNYLDRYALHAESLTFSHPTSRESITVRAPLAEDMSKIVEMLDAGEQATRAPRKRLRGMD